MDNEKKLKRGGKKEEALEEELEFIYGQLFEKRSSREILEEMQNEAFPLRSLGFIKRRRKEFNAAKRVLQKKVPSELDPVFAERRKEHYDKLRKLAEQLQNVLFIPYPSEVFLPDIPSYPFQYSMPGHFNVTVKKDKVKVTLSVEKQSLFPSLLSHLKAEFAEFHRFGEWKDKFEKLVGRCHQLARSVYQSIQKTASVTEMKTGGEAGVVFREFPRFAYEFILLSSVVGEREATPDLEVVSLPGMSRLTPKGRPALVLAQGNPQEIDSYKNTLRYQIGHFLSQPLPRQINELDTQLRECCDKLFLPALVVAIERGTFKPTKECVVCKGWL